MVHDGATLVPNTLAPRRIRAEAQWGLMRGRHWVSISRFERKQQTTFGAPANESLGDALDRDRLDLPAVERTPSTVS